MENNEKLNATFVSAIFEYLSSICMGDETVKRYFDRQNDLLLFVPSGIRKLKLNKNSFVKVLYLNEPSEIIQYLEKYKENKSVVFLVNIQKERFYNNKRLMEDIKGFNILYAPKLIIDKKGYRSKEHAFTIDKIYKRKCINVERLDEYLFYLVRLKILSQMFRGNEFVPDKIYASPTQNSVFPFVYTGQDETLFLFEDKKQLSIEYYKQLFKSANKKVKYLKLNIKNINNELKINISDVDEQINLSKKYQSIYLNKVEIKELFSNIDAFNEIYGAYYPDEFLDLFKYRKFEKTRYNYDNETYDFSPKPVFAYPESEKIEIGIRSALENDVIWFSNKKAVNDPFDLAGRIPSKYSIHMNEYYKIIEATDCNDIDTKFLTFCSTSSEDNILMWSHYGDCHKGTCIRYPMLEVIKTIQEDSNISICFYGKIKYKKDRTNFYFPFTTFRFLSLELAILRFNVTCMFEKYIDWKYEKEYRFLIIPAFSDKYADGYGARLKGSSIYLGNAFPSGYERYISRFFSTSKRFRLSKQEYKLD